jgi:hypothetical protein
VTLDPLFLSRLQWAWVIGWQPAFVTAEEFEGAVDPAKMTNPYVAAG